MTERNDKLPSTMSVQFFENLDLKKVQTSQCKVVLKDIFRCTVKMDKLSPEQIATALRSGYLSTKQITYAHQHDHCYTKTLIAPHTEDFPNTPTHSFTNTTSPSVRNFGSSYDIDSDDSDDSDDSFEYDCSVINGKAFAYPILFDENDPDAEKVDNTDNGRVTINGEVIGTKQKSIISDRRIEKFIQINGNGMDCDHTPVTMAEYDDEDDDLRFLNGIAEHLDRTENVEGSTTNCDENGHFWPSIRIFGNICLKHLRDECYGTFCVFPHELPTPDYVEKLLKIASCQEIEQAQNQLLLRHDILMAEFFSVFCKFYGREWQIHRESLRSLISVISIKPLASLYLKEILSGFLISGMEYSTCVQQLCHEIDESLNLEEQFELVWKLMIDARNDKVNEQLKDFETVLIGDALVSASAINKILELQINDDLESLREMVISLVKRSHSSTFRKINSTLLKQYVWHVRSFDLLASKAIQQRAKQFDTALNC